MNTAKLSKNEKIEKSILSELKKQTKVKCSGRDLNVEVKRNESSNRIDNYRPEGINMDSLEDCVGATLYGIFELNIVTADGYSSALYDLTIKSKLYYDGKDYKAEIIEPIIANRH